MNRIGIMPQRSRNEGHTDNSDLPFDVYFPSMEEGPFRNKWDFCYSTSST